jgi:hypothetical protein
VAQQAKCDDTVEKLITDSSRAEPPHGDDDDRNREAGMPSYIREIDWHITHQLGRRARPEGQANRDESQAGDKGPSGFLLGSCVNDPDSILAQQWGVRGVPTALVVDAQGRSSFREVGYTTGWGLRLRLWWAGL